MSDLRPLGRDEIEHTAAALRDDVRRTPTVRVPDDVATRLVGPGTDLRLKLELLQHTGTFKVRGALAVVRSLPPQDVARGLTAISAGNHALAVAWVARRLGTSAKVVMIRTANPFRVARARELGAEVVLADDAASGFALVERLAADEGRAYVHPFEGRRTALGTATVGLELADDAPDLDAVVVPIGGGGLAAGVASAIKLWIPGCAVYGVEPVGAPTMTAAFAAGGPVAIGPIRSIADSLGGPFTGPLSYALCKAALDEVVLVDDEQLRAAMRAAFHEFKLAVEPAGAAATAAVMGPLRARLTGKRVGLVVCGSNIDLPTWMALVAS
ncbi:MAG: pyridoxal-phosphate dependent enzyme [Planctomycetes bacterium]|nr:pyridoxal-phosphate dependent enzyme [Planctomycetota bacterium]